MAGFYVHIPFCRQACRYCDFYFTVSLKYMPDLVKAMIAEMEMRAGEYSGQLFETLYFGGGTPSLLTMDDLDRLLETVYRCYHFSEDVEFTFEVNPDDLTVQYIHDLKARGVNRLSIGIQSFRDQDLNLMRRSHSAETARKALSFALEAGITNMSADLMYGVPGMSTGDFVKNLEELIQFGIPHISAYHLTFEEGTVFDHWKKRGRISPPPEDESLQQYAALRKITKKKGYLHYEISNFAQEGFFSRHNLNYWKQIPYIGIGPSAHSYAGDIRRWNISSLSKYISSLQNMDGKYFDKEILTVVDLYNEYVLTSLRTMWGINTDEIGRRFGDNYVKYTMETANKFIRGGELKVNDSILCLSEKGIYLADYLVREFFMTE